ncbi:hypothetical protein H7Y29_03710 [Microbacteriaceae bacterium]|nr:hypothetical protein [Candidatus Saccharibacteria bacterium]
MKHYMRKTLPEEFFNHPAYLRALTLGSVYCFLAVMQLFTFEKFYPVVLQYMLPGGWVLAFIVTGLIPVLEVSALPYLLSMKVSNTTRMLSKYAVLATPALWLLLSLWLVFSADMIVESGLMGATLPVPSGLWLVVFSLLLLWSAYLVIKELPKRR